MTEKTKLLTLLFAVGLCFLAGCAQTRLQTQPIERIYTPDADKAKLMSIAENVLGQMNFVVVKSDNEQGVIRSKPLAGAQFFEFWRSDNVGSFNTAEANMHTIRRTVQLNVKPQQGKLSIDCDVRVQRLSLPERQATMGQMHRLFSKSRSSMQRLKLNSEQKAGMAWTDLGNDTELATEILRRIQKEIVNQQKGIEL